MSLMPAHHIRRRLFTIPRASFLRPDARIQLNFRRWLTALRAHDYRAPATHIAVQSRLISGTNNPAPLQQRTAGGIGEYSQSVDPLEHRFNRIIRDGQPDKIMNAFVSRRYEHLVGSLPQSIFSEAFLLLSPSYFIVPYRDIHQPLHPTAVKIKGHQSLSSIFEDFAGNLAAIVQTRQSAGKALSLAEYKHLLDCARSMGDSGMAELVWDAMLNDSAVTPDLQCYNYYMEAMVWEKSYTGEDRYHLRMTPFAYRKRANRYSRSWGWKGYGVQGRSVRKQVMRVFDEMTANGIPGDEATFVNILLGTARVGNVKGVKSVLKNVWNIHVDALCDDESEVPPPTPYERSSPLYPTDRLLFAVAQSFGTNSDMNAALRSVEFISRSYNIAVPERVWHELFERAFVLSRPRRGLDANAKRLGKVSPTLLFKMYVAMTSDPHNVEPTVDICRMMAKTAWDKRSLFEFQFFIRAAYKLLMEARRKRKEARLILEHYLAELIIDDKVNPLILESRGFAEAVRTYDLHRLCTAQHTIIVERLARLLLINRWWDSRTDTAWERWHLPRVFEEWQDFLPQTFDVATTAGIVKFAGKSGWSQQYLTTHRMISRRRRTADTEPDFEEEAPELDDDFFWERYKESSRLTNAGDLLLNRVLWAVGPGEDFVEYEGEVVRKVYIPPEGASKGYALARLLYTPVVPYRKPPRGRDHF